MTPSSAIKTLPLKLKKNGFEYIQIIRGKRSCIYQQRVLESVAYFEVFILKIQPERVVDGKTLEARERFPHDEAFGYWAWSIRKFKSAKLIFDKLENGGHYYD